MSRATLARRAIGDAQVPVQRIARLREHCGSLSRGAGRAVRIGSVYAAHKRSPEVFFSQSVCTTCSRRFWVSTSARPDPRNCPTPRWCGPHRQRAEPTPPIRAVGLLFPRLCQPTAAVTTREDYRATTRAADTDRSRLDDAAAARQTRAQQRANNIADQRRLNEPVRRRTHRRTQQTPTLLARVPKPTARQRRRRRDASRRARP